MNLKIGIPKALYYYYFYDKWKYFFKFLNIEVITSSDTNKKIIANGNRYANDEMCLSLKIFLGHVADLEGKCDYILIPKIDNYGIKDQMCCNFYVLYDLVSNLFDVPILTYEIDYKNDLEELDGLIKIGKELGFTKKQIKHAYHQACLEVRKETKKKIVDNTSKLSSMKKKILLLSHPYNTYDEYIGRPIIEYLEKLNCEVIFCDQFEKEVTNNFSKYLSRELYWKKAKENIGAIILCNEKVDGIVFLTTFPCGLDSLVNELVMRKISKPYLNLVLDDLDAQAGIETRIESFVDILEQD